MDTYQPGDRVRIAKGVLYAGRMGLVTETRLPGPKGQRIQVSVHEFGRMWYAPEELEHVTETEPRSGDHP